MKIGLFICHCGFNIASVINIPKVMDWFKNRKNLFVFDNTYLCSENGIHEIKEKIRDNGIERVVIAACSIRMHGRMFRNELEKIGIHRDLVEFVNIREQNSWVHPHEPELATQKAIEQIEAIITYIKLKEPTERMKVPIKKSVLVIGGGVAGIHGALAIANSGFKVILVEKDSTIGGHMALFDKTYPTLDCAICILGPIMNDVQNHPNIKLLTYSEVEKVDGFIGNFKVMIKRHPKYVIEDKCIGCFDICSGVCPIEIPNRFFPRKAIDVKFSQAVPLIPVIDMDYCTGCGACEVACDREAINYNDTEKYETYEVGAILVATGFKGFDPSGLREYNYGKNPDVITSLELERMLNPDGPTKGKIIVPSTGKFPRKIAYALCVGSRNKNINREYCSVVCCLYSIKHAILIKERVPNVDITIYYNDIRANTKGGEEFYNRAKEEFNIKFIKGAISQVQPAEQGKPMKVLAENTLEGKNVEEEYDLVVLAIGQDPPEGTNILSQKLNASLDQYGFFMESHLKIRPSQSNIQGIYVAGSIQGPKDIPQSILQAESAAAKIIEILNSNELEIDVIKVRLDSSKCDVCKLCLDVCDFQAIRLENGKIVLNSANCTGCGACTAMCHSGALYIPGFTNEQMDVIIDTILSQKHQKPLIIAFLCNWCAYAGADLAGTSKIQYPTNVRPIRVMCSAMVNPAWVVKAILKGADGVLIAGCYEQDCHYKTGFIKTKNRFASIIEIFKELNINIKRVRLESVSAAEGKKFASVIEDFSKQLYELELNKPEN
ncbi:MAG: hydrogenase iron-sulfur subunit [Promethearchaeota archaeon]